MEDGDKDELGKGMRELSTVKVKFCILIGICIIQVYIFIKAHQIVAEILSISLYVNFTLLFLCFVFIS